MNLAALTNRLAEQFQKIYGRIPRWIVAAPGRVNVIGEHTDYNDGFVLPMAIDRYALMAADFSVSNSKTSILDTRTNERAQVDVSTLVVKGEPKWSNYIRGVVAGFQNRGVKIPALDIVLNSTVPLGGGLSSSAALEVCAATLLEAATGVKIEPIEKALLCQKAEHKFAGVPCGIMDQFISAMARENHLLLLDCRSHKMEFVPMNDASVALLIINTNVKHDLAGSEYAKRREQCGIAAKVLGVSSLRDATADALERAKSNMSEIIFRRARHIISENERVLLAADGCRASHWPTVGRLMYASHNSLRDDYEVSCKELDAIVEIASSLQSKDGIFGCRMTGGGFGGCCVALVKSDDVETISKTIAERYKRKTEIEPTMFSSRPAAGAMILNN